MIRELRIPLVALLIALAIGWTTGRLLEGWHHGLHRQAATDFACNEAIRDMPEPQASRLWWACHERLRQAL